MTNLTIVSYIGPFLISAVRCPRIGGKERGTIFSQMLFWILILDFNFLCLLCLLVNIDTGKSFSEALILASVNPQYDKRLFIEFPEKYKFRTCCVQILF